MYLPRKLLLTFTAFAALAMSGIVVAQETAVSVATAIGHEDPIATRKWLMRGNGAAAGIGGAMLKGEKPYNADAAQMIFQSLNDVAYAFGNYFPEGSQTGDTRAAPAIWERPEEFRAQLAKFQEDTRAAMEAKPQDQATFQQLFGQVTQNCSACHENFRLERR